MPYMIIESEANENCPRNSESLIDNYFVNGAASAGGTVRKLDAAVRSASLHTARRFGSLNRARRSKFRQQRLRTNRACHVDRPRCEERYPHRRVR